MATELEAARVAAQMAARLCLAVREDMLATPDKMEKAGREPVTVADYGAQAVILHEIARHFPADGAVAEERAADFAAVATLAQRQRVVRHVVSAIGASASAEDIQVWLEFGRGVSSDRVWAVDPIDGTQGFLRGDQFAVAIALLVKGKLRVAVLACPLLSFDPARTGGPQGAIALAIQGGGATLESLDGRDSRPLHVSAIDRPGDARAIESVESGHTDHASSAGILVAAGIGKQTLRMDSQAKYAAVADGRAEIYIRRSPGEHYQEKIWDHAAGALIVAEAGGRVTDLNGHPLDFSAGDRLVRNRGILASNGSMHEVVLKAIRARR